MALGFSADGRRLASASADGTARVWPVWRPVPTEAEVATLLRCRVPWRLVGTSVVPVRPGGPGCP